MLALECSVRLRMHAHDIVGTMCLPQKSVRCCSENGYVSSAPRSPCVSQYALVIHIERSRYTVGMSAGLRTSSNPLGPLPVAADTPDAPQRDLPGSAPVLPCVSTSLSLHLLYLLLLCLYQPLSSVVSSVLGFDVACTLPLPTAARVFLLPF